MEVSLCIPRVECIYTKNDIQQIFDKCNLGEIGRIDIVSNHKEHAKYNRIFIHFKKMWNENAIERIRNGGSIKIVYNEPWYWKCTLSTILPKKIKH